MKNLIHPVVLASAMLPALTVSVLTAPVNVARADAPAQAETQFLDLAAKNGVNVLIDSTRIKSSQSPSQVPQSQNPLDLLVLLAQEQRFSTFSTDNKTLLVWAEPDPKALTEAILKGNGYGPEAGSWSNEKLTAELNSFFKIDAEQPDAQARPEANGSRRTTLKSERNFKLSELPPVLQEQVTAAFLTVMMGTTSKQHQEIWLDDAAWQNSSIYYRPMNPGIGGSQDSLNLVLNLRSTAASGQSMFNLRRGTGWLQNSQMAPVIDVNTQPAAAATLTLPTNDSTANIASPLGNTNTPTRLAVAPPRPQGTALRQLQAANNRTELPETGAFAAPVSLRVQRVSLTKFVKQLGQQANIPLKIAPETGADKLLVSSALAKMPLHEVMSSIERLYQLKWQKAGNAYVLQLDGRSATEHEIARMGNFQWYRFREHNTGFFKVQDEKFSALNARVTAAVGAGALQYPGVAFTSLPADLQRDLRQHSDQFVHRTFLRDQAAAFDHLNGDWAFTLKSERTFFTFNAPPRLLTSRQNLQLTRNGKPQYNLTLQPEPANSFTPRLANAPAPRNLN